MKIELGKTYINGFGERVRIICVDRGCQEYPVVGFLLGGNLAPTKNIKSYSQNGLFNKQNPDSSLNLVHEYHPAHEWEVDKPIWVRDKMNESWWARHFSSVCNGKVCAWADGKTSHSTDSEISWTFATDKNPYEEKEDE